MVSQGPLWWNIFYLDPKNGNNNENLLRIWKKIYEIVNIYKLRQQQKKTNKNELFHFNPAFILSELFIFEVIHSKFMQFYDSSLR